MYQGRYMTYRGVEFRRVDMITDEEKMMVLKNCVREKHYCSHCIYKESNDCITHLHLDIELYINWLKERIKVLEDCEREREKFEEVLEVPLDRPVKFVCKE